MNSQSEWSAAVVKVGDGRGFVVEGERKKRYIITTSHCLPCLPPAIGGISYAEERTYAALVGPIGGEQTVWAECLFVDPVADIAVLGSPDNQMLYHEAEAYEALIEGAAPLPIGKVPVTRTPVTLSTGDTILDLPKGECGGWLLSLDGKWFRCDVVVRTSALGIKNAAADIVGGMSGSPVVADNGSAIGIVVTSGGVGPTGHRSGGPNPSLAANLPGWLLSELTGV